MAKNKWYKDLGRRIEKIRRQRGITQEQLGELIGCSGPSISYFEKGLRKVSAYDLRKLSTALQVPLSSLIDQHEINFYSSPEASISEFDSEQNDLSSSNVHITHWNLVGSEKSTDERKSKILTNSKTYSPHLTL